MTAPNFITCFNVTAGFEGGYANNPHDPGHATMNGVTQAVYTRYLQTHGRHDAPVRGISLADRQAIYRQDFWNPVHGDELYAGLDLCVVDTAWGSGPVEAIKLLQRALGIAADGKFGLGTLAAVQRHRDDHGEAALITTVCDERMKFFRSLPTWKYFPGWTPRLNGIKAKALAMHKSASPSLRMLLSEVTDPSAAAPAQPAQKEDTTMLDAHPSLLDTLENLLVAALDAAPEVSKDFKAAVAEFQVLKASPIGVSLGNLISQLFSHSTALHGAMAVIGPSNSVHLPATNVAIVAPNVGS